jgi:hypothetical protein
MGYLELQQQQQQRQQICGAVTEVEVSDVAHMNVRG